MRTPPKRRASALASLALVAGALATSGVGLATAAGATTRGVAATRTPRVASTSSTDLAGVCPSTITIQTDWDPAVGNDFDLYELAASGGTIDASGKSYTAPLVFDGKKTGVKIQLLAGGKVVGYQSGGALMLEHSNILLADDSTDTDIEDSNKVHLVDLVSDFDNSALMIMWSKHTYPGVKTLSELGKTNATILYSEGSPYMTYLVDKGIFKAAAVSPSYTGSPANFIAAGGTDAQQGYETAEQFPNLAEVPTDLRALGDQPISAYGYDPYQNGIGTLPGYVSKYASCFTKLIPMIQQAGIDYFKSPARVDALIVTLTKDYADGWQYTLGDATYAAKQMVADKIVDTDPADVFGAEDPTRITELIDILTPILAAESTPPKAGLTAAQLYNGRFIDKSIHW